MCALIKNLPLSLSPLLFYHVKLICMFFFLSFVCFLSLVTPLFIELFWNNIYVSSKNEGADLMKTLQLFDFHCIPNCSGAFKVINWKIWEQALWITLICVMIRNLWLTMANHYIFLKKCLNCNNSYDTCRCVLCVKIECLLSIFQKKNRRENLKMSLQYYYINK